MPSQPTFTLEEVAYLFRIIIDRLDKLERAQAYKLTQEYLKTTDVCELLGMSEPTVRKLIRQGRLEATKPGGHFLISASSVAKLLESSRVK